jgi:hypothetical protein
LVRTAVVVERVAWMQVEGAEKVGWEVVGVAASGRGVGWGLTHS